MEKRALTNNFDANMKILGASNVAMLVFAAFQLFGLSFDIDGGISLFSPNQVFAHIFWFDLAFVLTSYWFSPDLDLRYNRPGKKSFPLKPVIKLSKYLSRKLSLFGFVFDLLSLVITPIHLVLNKVWNLYWQPLSYFLTHRGGLHWPIFGTQVKIVYMFVSYYLFYQLIITLDLPSVLYFLRDLPEVSGTPYEAVKEFYAEHLLGSPLLRSAFIAAMISDICHSAVDAKDSWSKGSKFVPPEAIAPRGLTIKAWKFFTAKLWGRR